MDILQAYKMVQDRPTIDELAKQTEILVTFFRQLQKNLQLAKSKLEKWNLYIDAEIALEKKRIRANQPIEHMKI